MDARAVIRDIKGNYQVQELKAIERAAKRQISRAKEREAFEKKRVTLNEEQGLYVIPTWCDGAGYSCLGFDVCVYRASAYAAWVGFVGPLPERGTLEMYACYVTLLGMVGEKNRRTGQRCEAELTPQLKGLEYKRVEVLDRYGERRRFTVGRSMGFVPIHLEIQPQDFVNGKWSEKDGDCTGGGAVTGAPFKEVRVLTHKGA